MVKIELVNETAQVQKFEIVRLKEKANTKKSNRNIPNTERLKIEK